MRIAPVNTDDDRIRTTLIGLVRVITNFGHAGRIGRQRVRTAPRPDLLRLLTNGFEQAPVVDDAECGTLQFGREFLASGNDFGPNTLIA